MVPKAQRKARALCSRQHRSYSLKARPTDEPNGALPADFNFPRDAAAWRTAGCRIRSTQQRGVGWAQGTTVVVQ